MEFGNRSQWKNGLVGLPPGPRAVRRDLIIPNPKLRLMEQVREVLRLKHYAIRTERCYCDWIKRYIHFHHMKLRDDLFAGPEAKIEEFLSDLAVRGQVAASTQNQLRASSRGCGSTWRTCASGTRRIFARAMGRCTCRAHWTGS